MIGQDLEHPAGSAETRQVRLIPNAINFEHPGAFPPGGWARQGESEIIGHPIRLAGSGESAAAKRPACHPAESGFGVRVRIISSTIAIA
jgi:hypothetical protein